MYEALFKEMAAKLKAVQKPDGYWAPSLLAAFDPHTPAESSGTGFFVYGMALLCTFIGLFELWRGFHWLLLPHPVFVSGTIWLLTGFLMVNLLVDRFQMAAHLEASKRNGQAKQTSLIGRYDRTEEEAPLSFAQERLWFIEQLQPGSALYHIKLRASFKGYLNVVALEMTLNEIVRRHEVLRTSFRDLGNGHVRQHISPMLSLPLPVTDLMHFPLNERAEIAQRLAREEEHQPFDLTQAPLLRARLFRFAEDEYLLVLTIHHIAADGWSMGVLVREVSELYPAYSNGHESPLAELPMQYADYATWQRDQMVYLYMEEQLIYWREQLRGARPLEFPTDRPRPAVLSRRGAEEPIALPEELSRELKRLADRRGCTPEALAGLGGTLWALDPDAAADLTQEFFTHALEKVRSQVEHAPQTEEVEARAG